MATLGAKWTFGACASRRAPVSLVAWCSLFLCPQRPRSRHGQFRYRRRFPGRWPRRNGRHMPSGIDIDGRRNHEGRWQCDGCCDEPADTGRGDIWQLRLAAMVPVAMTARANASIQSVKGSAVLCYSLWRQVLSRTSGRAPSRGLGRAPSET